MEKIIAEKIDRGEYRKPTAYLIGENGNIFNLMACCKRPLKDIPGAYKEMTDRITHDAQSYDEALRIIMDYVDVE